MRRRAVAAAVAAAARCGRPMNYLWAEASVGAERRTPPTDNSRLSPGAAPTPASSPSYLSLPTYSSFLCIGRSERESPLPG